MPPIQKKICLLGSFAVGKTSLVRRFVEGSFDDRYLSTIGVKISRRVVEGGGQTVNLLVWDLAGDGDFQGSAASYLRGAAGALLVCDLTRHETLEALTRYHRQLTEINGSIPLICVGNKADLVDERQISEEALALAAAALDSPYLITSAKTGAHVEAAFAQLAARMVAVP